jgi:hypothetical protein
VIPIFLAASVLMPGGASLMATAHSGVMKRTVCVFQRSFWACL